MNIIDYIAEEYEKAEPTGYWLIPPASGTSILVERLGSCIVILIMGYWTED